MNEGSNAVDSFILDGEELSRVKTKRARKNQLAFAVMLEFFQSKNYYPASHKNIPDALIYGLAKQLDIIQKEIEDFDWRGGNYSGRESHDILHISFHKILFFRVL